MGIRIEDSVCVGDDNPIVLTPEAVKEVCCGHSSILVWLLWPSGVLTNNHQVEDIEALRG